MNVLVIGGSGALGQAVIRQFQQSGATVRSFDLQPHPDSEVEQQIGDLRDLAALTTACWGMDVVVHTASLVSQKLGTPPALYEVNVRGTENVIQVCQAKGVGKLIYTSSIDVVFDGSPISDGDESLPYPQHHLDYYGTTKMLAEQAVLAANGVKGLATCSLRVAGLYGPGDKQRFPRVIDSIFTQKAVTRMGDGKARFNHLYIDNAAYAHQLAAEALPSRAGGEAYFITDYAATNFFDFIDSFVKALGLPFETRTMPYVAVRAIAEILELRHRLNPAKDTIDLSLYVVESTCKDFCFKHDKATRDLGYVPRVSQQEAFDRTLAWIQDWITMQGLKY